MKAFVVEEPRVGALRALNYAPAVERIRRAGSDTARPLHDLVKVFGPAYGTAFARRDCSPEHGVYLLSQADVFSAEPLGRVIRRDSMPHPERHLVAPNQVLIAGTGTLGENELYGRAVLADARLAGKYLSQDVMALIFDDPDDDYSLFSFAWLASSAGVEALRSTSYGSKLLRFRRELLSSLPVPLAPPTVVSTVASLVRACSRAREQFAEQMMSAASALNRVSVIAEATEALRTSGRRFSTWHGALRSLRAWNHVSTGRAMAVLAARSGSTIRDWLSPGDSVFHGLLRIRKWCTRPHGYDLLSQRDVFSLLRVPRRLQHPGCPDRSFFSPQAGILVASRGQIGPSNLFGRAELGSSVSADTGVSQDMLRVLPLASHLEVMFAFLCHPVGRSLVQGTAVGTSIPIVSVGLFADLPVPELPDSVMDAVRQHVRAAYAHRSAADAAHTEAIRIIEQEVLPQWLA